MLVSWVGSLFTVEGGSVGFEDLDKKKLNKLLLFSLNRFVTMFPDSLSLATEM